MKITQYKCDRCKNIVDEKNIFSLDVPYYKDIYRSIKMDLCRNCTEELTKFIYNYNINNDKTTVE